MECARADLLREYLGCWRDFNFTALPGGIRLVKPKPYLDILEVCVNQTLELGYQIFGVTKQYQPYQEICISAQDAGKSYAQDAGESYAQDAGESYARYGKSLGCRFGKGGVQALSVYSISCLGQHSFYLYSINSWFFELFEFLLSLHTTKWKLNVFDVARHFAMQVYFAIDSN